MFTNAYCILNIYIVNQSSRRGRKMKKKRRKQTKSNFMILKPLNDSKMHTKGSKILSGRMVPFTS